MAANKLKSNKSAKLVNHAARSNNKKNVYYKEL